jgi:pyruvate, water dikinase
MDSQEKLILEGMPASQGTINGKARIVLPNQKNSFQEGEILVTTLTDPTMVSMMIKAAAIVTDMGGITSHPAILSREMGIPCVVNTQKATEVIKDGALIKVDGNNGKIYAMD